MSSFGKDSAQLEREVEQQRQRVESRIGELRERLSPGQIVDELLSYGKDGGQQFVSNLGNTVANNPLPVAMLGISIAWLMAGQGAKPAQSQPSYPASQQPEYPYGVTAGRMRRVAHAADDGGDWYSTFEDDGGRRYRARSNEAGHRLGEFVDDAGRKFGGFIDEAGHRVRDFQDEIGNRLDDASGWASHQVHNLQRGIGDVVGQATDQAQQLGSAAGEQINRTTRAVMNGLHDQPLVAGALAFAAGAALAATLPHTAEEDRVLGKLSDQVKDQAQQVASAAYEEGKATVGDLYDRGKQGAAELYEDLKDKAARPGDLH